MGGWWEGRKKRKEKIEGVSSRAPTVLFALSSSMMPYCAKKGRCGRRAHAPNGKGSPGREGFRLVFNCVGELGGGGESTIIL